MRSQVQGLGEFIRERRCQGQLSLRRLSELAGVSNPYLSQIERGLRRPSERMIRAIAAALRVSAESLYVQAGLLEDRAAHPEVVRAIARDHGLTSRQKDDLSALYERYRTETADRRARRASRKLSAAAEGGR